MAGSIAQMVEHLPKQAKGPEFKPAVPIKKFKLGQTKLLISEETESTIN
jgi:hypothetical protein